MRYFIALTNTAQTPVDEHALQAAILDVGNPAGLPATDLAVRGYAEISPNDPVYDPATQYLGVPVNEQVAGLWQRNTPVLDYTPAELSTRTTARLDAKRTGAIAAIEAAAKAARAVYITPGYGQAMSYAEKAKQAAACLATFSATAPPAPGVYVLLDSEVGVTKNADGTPTANAYEVAAVIDAARQAWLRAEAAINKVRVTAKAAVKAASTATAIDTVMTTIVWP